MTTTTTHATLNRLNLEDNGDWSKLLPKRKMMEDGASNQWTYSTPEENLMGSLEPAEAERLLLAPRKGACYCYRTIGSSGMKRARVLRNGNDNGEANHQEKSNEPAALLNEDANKWQLHDEEEVRLLELAPRIPDGKELSLRGGTSLLKLSMRVPPRPSRSSNSILWQLLGPPLHAVTALNQVQDDEELWSEHAIVSPTISNDSNTTRRNVEEDMLASTITMPFPILPSCPESRRCTPGQNR